MARIADEVSVFPTRAMPKPLKGSQPQIENIADEIAAGARRNDLLTLLPAGAARNALDCALWDFEAKASGKRAHELADLPEPRAVTTAYTLSLGAPEAMETAARTASKRPLLKVKLGGDGDAERIAAVKRGAPKSMLIVDANEAWSEANFAENLAACCCAGVALIEQPLPSGGDGMLASISAEDRGGILFCADESVHTADDLEAIASLYQAINIKLDKAGGLTAALQLKARALARGLKIMIGCMVGTSLAMAPALLLASDADFVDLDGPLLLARDREPGLVFDGSLIKHFDAELWG